MEFMWTDIVALVVLALMIVRGWRVGFIVMAGNLASLVVGLFAAAWLFSLASRWPLLMNWHTAHPLIAIIVFLFLLVMVIRILRLLVHLLNAVYRFVSIMPGMGLVNHGLGAAVGLLEGGVLLMVVTYLLVHVVFAAGLVPSGAAWAIRSDSLIFPMLERAVSLLPGIDVWI